MEKYATRVGADHGALRRFPDLVEPVSIDEAFLDVTGSGRAMGSGEQIGRKLKAAIRDETGLTASVGVATSKLVAKVASDMRKPDGLVVVPPGTEAAFLAPLPVRRLWGVGPKMEETLAKLGVVDRQPGRARPGAPRAPARDARPRPAAARPRRGRPGGRVRAGGGEEPRPGAHLRPGHRGRRTAAGDAPGAGRRRRRPPAGARPAGPHRDPQVPGRGLPDDDPRPHPEGADRLGNALFRTASNLRRGAPREEGPSPRDLRVALRRGEAPARPLRGGVAPSPVDTVRDVIAKRFGGEAITRATSSAGASAAIPPTSPRAGGSPGAVTGRR